VNPRRLGCCAFFLLASLISAGRLSAQGVVCDEGNGPLDPTHPSGTTPAEIIQGFAAKEATFKAARARYAFTLDVNIQTFDRYGRTDGEYSQVSEITANESGKRVEKTTFAPENTLQRVLLSEEDLQDIRERLPFSLPPEDLPHYSISYTGRQHVDELNTYVFDVSPRNENKERNLFSGRIWVDDQDLVIVKTCGKPHQDVNAKSKKKNAEVDLTPVFVTYRQLIDGQFWFPTYSRADELLRFPKDMVHLREVVKFSNYKPLVRK